MAILWENHFIYKRTMPPEFLQSFSWFQAMYSATKNLINNACWSFSFFIKANLITWSKEALKTWLLSLENCKQVIPFAWAFSIFLKHCPVLILQTLIFPACEPVATISLSLENAMHNTACSIIMKFSWAWYFKSLRTFPVVKFHTSMIPSTLPVTRYWPSGENRAHSTWDFWPNFICFTICVGYISSSWSLMAALPLNKSIVVPRKLM